ncbi:DUF4268 domain-containing protein [Prauserella muralis]|uniref:DUF4268 domain-containing protein n=1 Tax=Prauserella muralis TaxID=588067 RepID=UPI0011AD0307|nr:DUF4268 domain-containing protein [Prauserella muralis]TWE22342.1 uncharacterized protein DUF4268 [Prauserella muralis]
MALREIWPHEALDFTPWLLDNADALGEALGMELDITTAEHPVGGFSLDLVGRDVGTNESVIVENQLETTDHSHLGQLLTYAGGTDAVNVVWIAREFREEHPAALDWLNARTDPDTRFFGVEVSAVRIGDSAPAPLFRVIVQPNDWGKTVRSHAHGGDSSGSDKNLLYAEFWDRYIAALGDAGLDWSRARKGPAQNWFNTTTGVAGAEFSVNFGRGDTVRSELYLGHHDPEINTSRFQRLQQSRTELEAAYGGTLTFQPLEGRKACRICEIGTGAVTDRDNWERLIGWFIDRQRRLRAALAEVGGITVA